MMWYLRREINTGGNYEIDMAVKLKGSYCRRMEGKAGK